MKKCFWIGVLLLLFQTNAWAQKSRNMPFYDDKKIHYGFQIGLHYADFGIKHSRLFTERADSTQYIQSEATPGFSLGFILNFKLVNELWSLRLLPTVSFYDRAVNFYYPKSQHTEVFESTFLEIPIMLKYKSVRRQNLRMYMTAGLMGGFEVGSKRDALSERSLTTNKYNLEVQYGFGCDMYFEMFKFAPELRFSHGLVNNLNQNGSQYARSLERITTHRITLYFNFE